MYFAHSIMCYFTNSARWSGAYPCQLGTRPQWRVWIFFYDYMLKDMCRGSWVILTTTGWVRNSTHSCRLSIDSDLSRRSGKLSREFIRVNRRWYSCWLEIIFMSYFYKSENEDWHMLILMLLSCTLHDNQLTCNWVLTLTEFGCKLFQLQDWILLSTVWSQRDLWSGCGFRDWKAGLNGWNWQSPGRQSGRRWYKVCCGDWMLSNDQCFCARNRNKKSWSGKAKNRNSTRIASAWHVSKGIHRKV